MIKFLQKYSNRFVSKWLVLTMDLFIAAFAFGLAALVRFNLAFTYSDPYLFKYHLFMVLIVKGIVFLALATHLGIIRHSNMEDAKQLLKATVLSSLILLILSNLNILTDSRLFSIAPSILIIDFFICTFGLVASRSLVKSLYDRFIDPLTVEKNVIIFGAGRLGKMTKDALQTTNKKSYKVLFFVDENPGKVGKSYEGLRVYNKADAMEIINKSDLKNIELIIAVQTIQAIRKRQITEEFLELGIPIRVVPPLEQWINGQLNPLQIAQVKIEDLLERPKIEVNNRMVTHVMGGKRVLITGAAGSIGSEIVRQMIKFHPSEIILLDQAESPLYDMETELTRLVNDNNLKPKFKFEVRNVTNTRQMERIFRHYKPEIVFHAAAYKHVPLMESNPFKAVEVNSLGTMGLADLAIKHKVERFVFVSTDKAVNPTNVMGASKRLAEIYIQSLNSDPNVATRFVTTRFGNVLGSNGSVIPLFRKQIEKGGPVTVTDKRIIRYFMTIPEACQLVLEAGTMGKGGEIYVFDMGEPVLILGLAEKMIRLSGFEPYKQIPIVFTGLRPGEKLFEELLNTDETTLPTHHPKIMVAKVFPHNHDEVKVRMVELSKNLNELNNDGIVSFLKDLIPEYVSNNSPYEELDHEEEKETGEEEPNSKLLTSVPINIQD